MKVSEMDSQNDKSLKNKIQKFNDSFVEESGNYNEAIEVDSYEALIVTKGRK